MGTSLLFVRLLNRARAIGLARGIGMEQITSQRQEVTAPSAPAWFSVDAWPGAEPITALIVDGSPASREGLRSILETEESLRVIGEAVDGAEALKRVNELEPTAVLWDLRMPNADGLEATRLIKAQHPNTAVIVMADCENDEMVIGAIRAGANGYLQKDASRELLVRAIGAAAAGGVVVEAAALRKAIDHLSQSQPAAARYRMPSGAPQLSERELKVLKLLGEGQTNREIGSSLGLAEITVKKHVQSIVCKLGAADRTQAATTALRLGLIQ